MDGGFDGALVAMEAELRMNLTIDGVLPLLEREAGGFMTKEEKMDVMSVNRENTPEMVTRIINILRKKGDNEFDIFLDILDKSGNNVWANKLRECVGQPQRVLSKNKPQDPNRLTIIDMMPYVGELASLGLQLSGWLDMGSAWAAIAKTPGTPQDHVQKLLTQWLSDEEDPDIPHTWTHFIEVVRGCKRGKLAGKMEREVLGREHEEPSAVEILDCRPSDQGLLEVTRMLPQPQLNEVAVRLGVPFHIVADLGRHYISGGMRVLMYWRDGMFGPDYPVTWRFLLDAVSKACGPGVAGQLEREVLENRQSWCESIGTIEEQTGGPPHSVPSETSEPSKNPEHQFPVLRTTREFMEYFQQEFLAEDVVDGRMIADKLFAGEVIPQSLRYRLMRADDDYQVASDIFNYMKEQGDYASLKRLCEIMLKEDGMKAMNKLGKKMLECLEANKGLDVLSEPAGSSGFESTIKEQVGGPPHSVSSKTSEPSKNPERQFPVLRTTREFMEYFQEEFLDGVDGRMIANKLFSKRVIPQSLRYRLMIADDDYQVASGIFSHMKGQGNSASLKSLCKIMIEEGGMMRMNNLGKKMLECLEANKGLDMLSELAGSSGFENEKEFMLPVQETEEVQTMHCVPSNLGLLGVAGEILHEWSEVAVCLGVPWSQVSDFRKHGDDIGGMQALRYWRDGRCEPDSPVTWRFLLHAVSKACGPGVAKQLERKLLENRQSWCQSTDPLDVFGDDFKKAVESNACIRLTITKCTTIGPPRIGKTCLKHLLTRKAWDIEKDMPSTPAIRAPEWVECYRGETDSLGKNWSTFSREERIKALYQSIAKEEYDANERMESQQSGEGDGIISTGSSTDDMDVQSQSTHTKSLLDDIEVEGATAVMETVAQESLRHSPEYLRLQEVLKKLHIPDELQVVKEKEGQVLHKMQILHFIDTGGHEIYHDVHPVLITSPSVYLVVFNLGSVKTDFLTTDLTQQALRSIHTLSSKCPESKGYLSSQPEEPKIFLIGTHLDKIQREDPQIPLLDDPSLNDLHKEMEKRTRDMPYCDYIQYDTRGRCFWAVDNTQAGKETSEDTAEYLDYLRELIVEESMTMDLSLPIPWLILEQLASTCKPLFEYKSICQLAMDKKLVKDEQEFKVMLRVFHSLGLFFYVPDVSSPSSRNYIFADPNVLYTLTSELFFKLQTENPAYITRQMVCGLIKPLAEEMVEGGSVKEALEIDAVWLIELLCQLRLMATFGDDPDSRCIIPAALPNSEDEIPLANGSVGSLLLTFITKRKHFSYLPSGLFCAFIAEIIRAQPEGITWKPVMLYRHLITFDIGFGHLRIKENHATIKIDFTLQGEPQLNVSEICQHLRKILHDQACRVWLDLYHRSSSDFEATATWGICCACHEDNHSEEEHIAKCIKNPNTGRYYALCKKSQLGVFQSLSKAEAVWFMDVDF